MSGTDLQETRPSAEFFALEAMFLALVYELNQAPDFPRKGLVQALGKLAQRLRTDGDSAAADMVLRVQIGLSIELGD